MTTKKGYEWWNISLILSDIHLISHNAKEQFTGITDANGKDIYEGDIILQSIVVPGFPKNEFVAVVEYEGDGFVLWKDKDTPPHYLRPRMFHEIRVIGNIHQNPELLERK